jgi:anti-sigma28 factor (negative regulator of flagellin synthesis)
MAISPVDSITSYENAKEAKKKVDTSERQSAQNVNDKVDLSPEAKKLHDVQVQNKFSEIHSKIASGFYNSDEVLSSVAGSIIKVIRNG